MSCLCLVLLAVSSILALCLLAIPVEFVFPLPEDTRQVIVAVVFALGAISTTLVLFGPKALDIYYMFYPKAVSQSSKKVAAMESSREVGTDGPLLIENIQQLKKRPVEDQLRVGNEQIAQWRAFVMHVNEKDSNSNSSQSKASVVHPPGHHEYNDPVAVLAHQQRYNEDLKHNWDEASQSMTSVAISVGHRGQVCLTHRPEQDIENMHHNLDDVHAF